MGVFGGFSEESLELVPSPLDSMFYSVREVLESAHRDGLLRRVLGRRIGFCYMRQHYLQIYSDCFGEKNSGVTYGGGGGAF